MNRPAWSVVLSVWVYRRLLGIYPAGFRHAYGLLMVQLFQDCSCAAYRQRGSCGLGLLWSHTVRDLAATGLREHLSAWRERNRSMTPATRLAWLWPWPVTLILALIVAYVNLHTDETGVVALPMILVAAALGFARPRGAILWGLLLGVGIPLGQAWAARAGWHLPYPNSWANVRAVWLVPLVPMMAALLGAGTRWLVPRALPAEL
ncbi:MAG: hypothetical protein M3Z04_05140 [Chloroflexota bacterium]|nr:hypothetical protein [Chloroflexota bacterium]